jgi:hypothetical protein
MKILHEMPDAAVVLHFLHAEKASSRYGPAVTAERGSSLIDFPDLANADVNAERKALLHKVTRHDGPVGLFDGFPVDVRWWVAQPTEAELLESRYVNLPAWVWFSQGTRTIYDGARTVVEWGGALGNIPSALFWAMVQETTNARATLLPRTILVAPSVVSVPVILDGHLRLTAWAIAKRIGARWVDTPSVIVGTSPGLSTWPLW